MLVCYRKDTNKTISILKGHSGLLRTETGMMLFSVLNAIKQDKDPSINKKRHDLSRGSRV